MKKVCVIYWSCGGAVETLAKEMKKTAERLGESVLIKNVQDAEMIDVSEAQVIVIGSPSMNDGMIEQYEMEPFVENLKNLKNKDKQVILYGTCAFNEDDFLDVWEKRLTDYGFNVVGKIAIKDSGSEEEIRMCRNLIGKIVK